MGRLTRAAQRFMLFLVSPVDPARFSTLYWTGRNEAYDHASFATGNTSERLFL